MKVKALYSGFDGYKSYDSGEELSDKKHNRAHLESLVFNGNAEPVDKEAKDLLNERKSLKGDDLINHHLHSESHLSISESNHGKSTLGLRTAIKTSKKKANSK